MLFHSFLLPLLQKQDNRIVRQEREDESEEEEEVISDEGDPSRGGRLTIPADKKLSGEFVPPENRGGLD